MRILILSFCFAVFASVGLAGPEADVPVDPNEYRTWAAKGKYRMLFRVQQAKVARPAKQVAKDVEAYMRRCVEGYATGLQEVEKTLFYERKGQVVSVTSYGMDKVRSGNVTTLFGLKAHLTKKRGLVKQQMFMLYEPFVDVVPQEGGTAVQVIRMIHNKKVAKEILAVAGGKQGKCVPLGM